MEQASNCAATVFQRVEPEILSCPAEAASLCGDWFAVPDGRRGNVLLWSGIECGSIHHPTMLQGMHASRVSALRFWSSEGKSTALYTASTDCLARWNVEQENSVLQNNLQGHVITTQCFENPPPHIAVNTSGDRLAVCDGCCTKVIDIASGHIRARLEGHTASVTAAEFRDGDEGNLCLVTVAEDRRFLIFDLTQQCIMYQSAIISSSPFISLAVEPAGTRCALGSSDGIVRVYDLSTGDYRMLHSFDVPALTGLKDRPWHKKKDAELDARKKEDGETVVISSEPAWKRMMMETQEALEGEDADAATLSERAVRECPVISLCFSPSVAPHVPEDAEQKNIQAARPRAADAQAIRLSAAGGQRSSSNEWYDMANRAPALIVGTPSCVISTSLVTGDIQLALWLENSETPDTSTCAVKAWEAMPAGTAGFIALTALSNGVRMLAAAAFLPSLYVASAMPAVAPALASQGGAQALFTAAHGAILSVFPSCPPPAGSILSDDRGRDRRLSADDATPKPMARSKSGGRESLGAIMRSSGVSKDQPITFHNKIRSSSYGASRPMPLFGVSGAKTAKKPPTSKSASVGSKGMLAKVYPTDAGLPRHRQCEMESYAPQHTAPVRRISFAGDASRLATASADKTVCVVRTPVRKYAGEGSYLTGHKGPVHTVAWSRDSSLLVSSAADKSVRVWSPDKSTCEALLVIDRRQNQHKPGLSRQEEDANPAFAHDVRDACFFYMDRFIVAAVGKQLLFYSYSLADIASTCKDDIERLRKNHKYKLAACLETSAQSITAMACANGFLSHMVLAAGSHKHIDAWDVAVQKCVHTFQDAHDKPVHCVRLNDAGTFASHPAESYDVFLSVSSDRYVTMWDMRTGSRVCKLAGHSNRVHAVGASFSPCMRYVACGSEDKQAYVYDIRSGSGTFVDKLGGHTDVVTDVCFNPLHPQLVTACGDGKIRAFSDKE